MQRVIATFLLSIIILCHANYKIHASDIAIGSWRHHLPNNEITRLAETNQHIIGATPYGMVAYNKADQSMKRINKVDGLNDFGLSAIQWHQQEGLLIIGYENGNLDLMRNGQFVNIPDIMQASILGSKTINQIIITEGSTLLACDFGVVEMDVANRLILDTWFIGPFGSMVNVNDMLVTDSLIYAATNAGLLYADAGTTNLADYRNWNRMGVTRDDDETFHFVVSHAGKVFVSREDPDGDTLLFHDGTDWIELAPPGGFDDSAIRYVRSSDHRLIVASGKRLDVFDHNLDIIKQLDSYYGGSPTPQDALYDSEGRLWIADDGHGLVKQQGPQSYEQIVLEGMDYPNAFSLDASDGTIWVAPGGKSYIGSNEWNQHGYYFFENGKWTRYRRSQFPVLDNVTDIIDITVDPSNPQRAYASAWFGGLAVVSTEGVIRLYDETNSTLRKRSGLDDYLRVGGTAIDRDGNVWVTNSETDHPLSVKLPDGEWMAFGSGGTFGTQTRVGNLIIDNHGQKWANLHGNGIFLFKEHTLAHTNSFDARRLTTQSGNGGLPSNRVHSMAVDHNGYVWIGTAEGVGVFYSPGRAFDGDAFDAQRIIVQQEDGFAGYLLETETVTAITVDGSNKKWFGTERSGAFLLSADGRETIFHFNESNSPLPSNNILDIAVNEKNGEVFFATDRGLASYRGFATEAGIRHSDDVYAYPNPVRRGYDGYIAVKGLVRNANVKITDISGNLVWETVAEGGQAIWNGQDLRGRRPGTGVYLVFSTNDDGEETMVTKIMFMN